MSRSDTWQADHAAASPGERPLGIDGLLERVRGGYERIEARWWTSGTRRCVSGTG